MYLLDLPAEVVLRNSIGMLRELGREFSYSNVSFDVNQLSLP